VVVFFPEDTTELLVELSTLGHALSWDLVMDLTEEPSVRPADVRVEPLEPGDELWSRIEESLALFGNDPTVAEQLRSIEQETFSGGHKRWLGVRDDEGEIAALAALVQLEGVGYLDNVVTFPDARAGAGDGHRRASGRAGSRGRRRAREPVRGSGCARGRPDVRTARLPGSGAARIHQRARRRRRASRRN
jgi:hypothetical protein